MPPQIEIPVDKPLDQWTLEQLEFRAEELQEDYNQRQMFLDGTSEGIGLSMARGMIAYEISLRKERCAKP